MNDARILDGKALSQLIVEDLAEKTRALEPKMGRCPGLGVILVGDNPASKTYVANKEKAAAKAGFVSFDKRLPNDASETHLEEAIQDFNQDERVDGILLQLPLPKHLRADRFLDMISPKKDADGLHPLNQGLLLRGDGKVKPCTPAGVMKLIDLAYDSNTPFETRISPPVDLAGKKAIVIGRSILVGKPMGTLLLARNATVIMAHSKTPDLAGLCASCDLVVAAVGVANLVKGKWIKERAVVIDVGINRNDEGKLTGDVDFEEARPRSFAISPVPGGVGPMTIAMLLENTFEIYQANLG